MIVYWLKHRGTMFPVPPGEVVIGRSPQHSLVVLSGERVSRRHAMVRATDQGLLVQDMHSRNGTFVNGERLATERLLKEGDILSIGDERLEVLQRASRSIQRTLTDDDDDDASTVTERNAIGLVEELVARAAETGERRAVASTIREMIDAVIESTERTGHSLAYREAVRLAAAASVVASWQNDGSLDRWSLGVRRIAEGP